MHERVLAQIKFEISQIDQLLSAYDDLLRRIEADTPDLVETTAMASVLHSFYNGGENIFRTIARGVDNSEPTGAHWHRELLSQMAQPNANRPPILTPEAADQLASYLAFRHFYRHSYSFYLDWIELEHLAVSSPDTWTTLKAELETFVQL